MNLKGYVSRIVLLALSLVILGGCVSKKDYLIKVGESEKLSHELETLKSQYTELNGEKQALEKEVAHLKNHNKELKETSQAQSDTLKNNIVGLKSEVDALNERNRLLSEENKVLRSQEEDRERQRKEEMEEMRGTYQNMLEDMKSEIEKGNVTITQLKGKLKVNMLDEILFDSGKTTIKPQGIEVLKKVGNVLLNVKERVISVEGHTDNVPIGIGLEKRYPTNWELSAARASNVVRYLHEKIGIDPWLLSATGYGEYQPVASNDIEDGRAKNRRIEIVLVPREITPFSRQRNE